MSLKHSKSTEKSNCRLPKDVKLLKLGSQSAKQRLLVQSESNQDASVNKVALQCRNATRQKTRPPGRYIVVGKNYEDTEQTTVQNASKVGLTLDYTPLSEHRSKSSLTDHNGRSMFKLPDHEMQTERQFNINMGYSSSEISPISPSSQVKLRSSSRAISTRSGLKNLDHDDGYSSLRKHKIPTSKPVISSRSESVAVSNYVLDSVMSVGSNSVISSLMSVDEELEENFFGFSSHKNLMLDDPAKQLNFDESEVILQVPRIDNNTRRQHDDELEISSLDESECKVSLTSLGSLGEEHIPSRPRCSTARKARKSKQRFSDVEPSSDSDNDCISLSCGSVNKELVLTGSSKALASMTGVVHEGLKPGVIESQVENIESGNGHLDLKPYKMFDDGDMDELELAEKVCKKVVPFDQVDDWLLPHVESLSDEPSKVYHHHKNESFIAIEASRASRAKIKKHRPHSRSKSGANIIEKSKSPCRYGLGVTKPVVENESVGSKDASAVCKSRKRRMTSSGSKSVPARIRQSEVNENSAENSNETEKYTTVNSFVASLQPKKKPHRSQTSSRVLQKQPAEIELSPDEEELEKMKELDDIADNYELCID